MATIAFAAGLFCAIGSRNASAQIAPTTPLRLDWTISAPSPLSRDMTPAADCTSLGSDAGTHLTLVNALAYVVCSSPALLQALAQVEEQRASVDLAQAAFRPRTAFSAELAANRTPASNSTPGSLGASITSAIGLTWTVLDFGARAAALRQAQFGLSASEAARQNAMLANLNEGIRLYIDAASAWAKLEALRESERIARRSEEVALARYKALTASLSEVLQAQTALAQTTADRVRADGTWEVARSDLALAMNLPLQTRIGFAPLELAFPAAAPAAMADRSGATQAALRDHPRVRALEFEINGLRARLAGAVAESKGSLSLSAGLAATRDLTQSGNGLDKRINGSLTLNIPLFNGAEQSAIQRQIEAQLASREASLTALRRELQQTLWRSEQLATSEVQNVAASNMVLASATKNHAIALGRYQAGVGAMTELLGAQLQLANATVQGVQARLQLGQADLQLILATGQTYWVR